MAIVVGAACRVTGRKGALLRAEAALTSALECTLPSASEVTVLEVTKLADGTARAKVASDLGTGFMSCKLLEPVAVHGAEFARPVRVLGLHGGGASAKVMEYQTLAVRKELGERATWEFLDGTRPWESEVDPMLKMMFDGGPFHGWYGVEDDGDPERPYNDRLFDEAVNFTYTEVRKGILRVEDYIRNRGPFDVLVGFSQGTIISTLVTAAALQRGESPSWRGNVLVCASPGVFVLSVSMAADEYPTLFKV